MRWRIVGGRDVDRDARVRGTRRACPTAPASGGRPRSRPPGPVPVTERPRARNCPAPSRCRSGASPWQRRQGWPASMPALIITLSVARHDQRVGPPEASSRGSRNSRRCCASRSARRRRGPPPPCCGAARPGAPRTPRVRRAGSPCSPLRTRMKGRACACCIGCHVRPPLEAVSPRPPKRSRRTGRSRSAPADAIGGRAATPSPATMHIARLPGPPQRTRRRRTGAGLSGLSQAVT